MQTRRRFVRWLVNREAKLQLPESEECVGCRVNDINYKGARVTSTAELKKDRYISLSLTLSEGPVLILEVWVAWHKIIEGHNIYGLYFSKIRDFDKEQIYRFISKYYPEQIEAKWWGGIIEEPKLEKGGEQMDDRRIFERFVVSYPVSFLDQSRDKEGAAQGKDASAKGLGIASEEELKPGTALEIWIQVPDNAEPLYARGVVAWCSKQEGKNFKIGLKLEKADLMGLSRLLRHQS